MCCIRHESVTKSHKSESNLTLSVGLCVCVYLDDSPAQTGHRLSLRTDELCRLYSWATCICPASQPLLQSCISVKKGEYLRPSHSLRVRSGIHDIKIVIHPCLPGSMQTPLWTSTCSPKFVTAWTVLLESMPTAHRVGIKKCSDLTCFTGENIDSNFSFHLTTTTTEEECNSSHSSKNVLFFRSVEPLLFFLLLSLPC